MADRFSVVGVSKPRVDGVEKVTGKAKYAADILLPGMLYAKMKRSPHAHARVIRVDKSKALALDGVKAVISIEDVPHMPHAGSPAPRTVSLVADQYIFPEKVRFVGDGVAAVAAISEAVAEEALDLIEVEYEVLPAVFDVEAAMQPGAPLVHDTPGNAAMSPVLLEHGDVEKGFAEADLIVESVYTTGRPAPAYMEPNACVCQFSADGKLTIWSSTQSPFMVRGILSEVLGIPEHKIRVIVEHMGGGFGGKQDLYQHEFVCALLAQKTGRPVKMEYTRTESFVGGKSRHPVTVRLKQGVKADGTITAREALYISNTGGYASHGPGITYVGCIELTSLYNCQENWRIEGRSIYTNAPIAGAFRGYGGVQAFFALDCQMDEIAAQLGIDPVDFRLLNAVGEGDLTPSMHRLHRDVLAKCLIRGAQEVNWYEERKKTAAQSPGLRKRRGWGVGCEMHSSGAYPDIREQSNAILEMNGDGTVTLLTGAADLGTGAKTVLAQIAAEELGIPFETITVVSGDTDIVPFDIGAYASRTTYVAGNTVRLAAANLKSQLLELASDKLQATPEELAVANGAIFVKDNPDRSVTITELVGAEGGTPSRSLVGKAHHEAEVAYSFAAHFAEVEVDTETGQVEVKQVVAVHEMGRAINPQSVEGQIEGGIQQGLGHTLTEELIVDPQTGRYLNPNFTDYKMPLSLDMPPIKTIILEEDPDTTAPYGAKGVGEDPIIAIGPAIANAIYDAVGVRIREYPITAEKVLAALKAKRDAE